MGFSAPFDTLLYGGAASGNSGVPNRFQVALNGVGYIIDPAQYQRTTVPIRRQPLDESVEPGEQCADEATEILSDRGWITHDDLRVGDQVLTLNVATGMSEWGPVREVFRYQRTDLPMWKMEGKGHSSLTTAGHRWPVSRPHWKTGVRTLSWKTSATLNTADSILHAAPYADAPVEAKYTDDFVELVAWYWTEGNVTWDWRKEHERRVTISQHPGPNPEKVARIRACFTRLFGLPRKGSTWYEYVNPSNGVHLFHLHRGMFDELLSVAPGKIVDLGFIRALTRAQLDLFIDVSVLGDGTRQGSHFVLSQKSKAMIEPFHIACVLAGRRARLRYDERAGEPPLTPHWKVAASQRRVLTNPHANQRQANGCTVTQVSYTGTVWCPNTDNGTWFARRNGTCYFTGNSLNTNGVWLRSQDNWFLGAGQRYMDNRFAFVSVYTHSGESPSVRTRFWRSKGVDPWTEGSLSLLPECNLKGSSAGTGQFVIAVGSSLYWWNGSVLQYTTNPTVSSPTWTSVAYPAGVGLAAWPTITSAATDGQTLWLAAGSYGIIQTSLNTATSTVLRATPAAPTVSPLSTGSVTYTYYVVATDNNGYKSLVSAATTITNGATGPNNLVTWAAVNGAVSYDVLRGDTGHSVALAQTGTSFTDTVAVAAVYTAPTATTLNCQASFVQYANGYLLAGVANLLCNVLRSGMSVLVWNHPNGSYTWDTAAPAPSVIYVAGHAGNVSELYGVQVDPTTGFLGAPYIAGQVTAGEIIRDLVYYEGLVAVTTSLGIRVGQDQTLTGHLQTGPIITGPTTVTGPGDSKCCVASGPYVYFGWSAFSASADGIYPNAAISSGLGRLFLSEFSTSLQPAYATDLMATDGVAGTTTSVAIIAGVAYFTVDGSGIWGPDSNRVASGWLEPGWVRYGLIQNKILVSIDVRHEPLAGTIDLQVVPFGLPAVPLASSITAGSIGPGSPFTTGLLVGEAFAPIITLNRSASDNTAGPTLHRWTVSALPAPTRQDEIVVPIMMAKTVRSPSREGEDIPYDPLAVFQTLKALEQSGSIVTYQEGAAAYSCFIDQIEVKASKWADDFSFFEGLLLVKLLTVV